jgi:hypothetical protein
MNFKLAKKLVNLYIWKRIFYERLSEPLHLNFISFLIAIFGNYRRKIEFDLIIRQQHAYSLLNVADQAKALGYERISIFEFGVASGAGLINLQEVSKQITKFTNIHFDIYGFDSGEGMPAPKSFKDHPELYQSGDFPMNHLKLLKQLENRTHLILGPISESISSFLRKDFSKSPVAFVSIDVDYYSSTMDALALLCHEALNMLPRVIIYLDDLEDLNHNSWCGEQAAIIEFTKNNPMRPIEKHSFLRGYRIFKNARWIDHIYQCHVLDHPIRNNLKTNRAKTILENPYIG